MPMPPRLLALATAVPPHVLSQAAVMEGARQVFGALPAEMARLAPIYTNAGVERRQSCVPLDWYTEPRGWAERNRLYIEHALPLLEAAARDCLEQAALSPQEVDCLVVVSSTGIATPSLDALLMERLPFRRDVTRLPVFGLGCAGGVLGLGRAAAMAQVRPGSRVLLLVVELCGLTFRANDMSTSNIVATALFGDGAAAVLLGPGEGPAVTAWGEHTWPGSLDVMGWRVEDDGLGVVFAQSIPILVRDRLRPAAEAFLAGNGLSLADLDRHLCHPGGAKVVTALEQAYGLPQGQLAHERAVLRDHGNMSAATLLFVLQRGWADGLSGLTLLTALGPGFCAGFVVLEAP